MNEPRPRLQLPAGWIEGVSQPAELPNQPTVHAYKGVPYGQAPVGDLRWQAPQAPSPWAGTRHCEQFGPVAVQANPAGSGHLGSHDCLTLNVWCPAPGNAPLPVMVWIPGGGFMRGGASDALYDGAAMARQGVVFVSINYRIGTDGFMQFDEAASNRGLQDQLAALAWVQEHVALFGGDPLRVTVAGVSAGAGAITHLMGLAQANTLFQQVILQSPSLQSHSLDDAQRIRHAMAGVLGTTPDLAGLAAAPLTALTQALLSFLGNEALKKQWGIRPKNFFPVRPVVDGQLLHAEPLAAIQQQLEHGAPRRPVLLGYNADEMNFFLVPNGDLDRIDMQRLEEFAADIGWPAGALDTCLAQMQKASPGEVLSRIQTDHYYRQPAVALEQLLRLAGCPTFLYEFGWQSPLHNGRMGAAHAMEIPFVLGNTASARAQEFIGALAPARLAGDMHATWAQFVLSGTPGLWPVDERGIHVFA